MHRKLRLRKEVVSQNESMMFDISHEGMHFYEFSDQFAYSQFLSLVNSQAIAHYASFFLMHQLISLSLQSHTHTVRGPALSF